MNQLINILVGIAIATPTVDAGGDINIPAQPAALCTSPTLVSAKEHSPDFMANLDQALRDFDGGCSRQLNVPDSDVVPSEKPEARPK